MMRRCRHCGVNPATSDMGPASCDGCTASLNREATRRRMSRYRSGRPARRVAARLKVTCWCELEFVTVPRSEILNGRTASCGLPSCRPLVEVCNA